MNKKLLKWLQSKESDKFFSNLLWKMGRLGRNVDALKYDKSIWEMFEILCTIYMVRKKIVKKLKFRLWSRLMK